MLPFAVGCWARSLPKALGRAVITSRRVWAPRECFRSDAKTPPWHSPHGVDLALCRCASQVPSPFGLRLEEVETTDASASLPFFPPIECLNGGRPANCGGDLGKEPRPFVGGLGESDVSPERDLRRMNCLPWRRS